MNSPVRDIRHTRTRRKYDFGVLMKQSSEIVRLAGEVRTRLNLLSTRTTPMVRATRRVFSRAIAAVPPEIVWQLALHLLEDDSELLRFFCYEMLTHHRRAWEQLSTDDLLKLGRGLNSWSSVDCFAMYLAGPMWAEGRLANETIDAWARGEDRWWRRAALVSTVALSRRAGPEDLHRVLRVCGLLAADTDDMVVKAQSWALREAAKKHPREVRAFLVEKEHNLAARVVREVNNKLRTGLKTPRPSTPGR